MAATAPDVDPIVRVPFRISPSDRIVTAGSCFAQHIARYLRNNGFNYLVTERAHPMISTSVANEFNYGTFSARYGNIYTSRQLRQLIDRAYGHFVPKDDVWSTADGFLVDPFRPQIQPRGFHTAQEFQADRDKHFRGVREALERLDVFVFTLGLTECWRARDDGAVYPLCPGVAGGTFAPDQHEFHNLTVRETVDDLCASINALRRINPKARVILTVSPVPLVATASGEHVLVATTYSKSVLRVAAQEVVEALEDVFYFPSYEIITGNHSRGSYFAEDLRSVTEQGVSHVMRVFFRHLAGQELDGLQTVEDPALDVAIAEMARLVQVNCDEEALDRT